MMGYDMVTQKNGGLTWFNYQEGWYNMEKLRQWDV